MIESYMNPALTRQARVLEALKVAARDGSLRIEGKRYRTPNGYVDGWLLTHPSIGGSEGLRRLRELRADGTQIEMVKIEDRETRQYRLKPEQAQTRLELVQ